jgi:hypothetical protein
MYLASIILIAFATAYASSQSTMQDIVAKDMMAKAFDANSIHRSVVTHHSNEIHLSANAYIIFLTCEDVEARRWSSIGLPLGVCIPTFFGSFNSYSIYTENTKVTPNRGTGGSSLTLNVADYLLSDCTGPVILSEFKYPAEGCSAMGSGNYAKYIPSIPTTVGPTGGLLIKYVSHIPLILDML